MKYYVFGERNCVRENKKVFFEKKTKISVEE